MRIGRPREAVSRVEWLHLTIGRRQKGDLSRGSGKCDRRHQIVCDV